MQDGDAGMQTFLLERAVPPMFRFEDPAEIARHSRWALDGYQAMGAAWYGGVVTDAGMFSLVSAGSADDLRRYWRSLGVAEGDARLRAVLGVVGPFAAGARA
jgi:hypothetical protein